MGTYALQMFDIWLTQRHRYLINVRWPSQTQRVHATRHESLYLSCEQTFTTGTLPVQPSSRGACDGSLHSNWGRLARQRRLRRTRSMSMDCVAQSTWHHQQRWRLRRKKTWPATALWEPWTPGGKEKQGDFLEMKNSVFMLVIHQTASPSLLEAI